MAKQDEQAHLYSQHAAYLIAFIGILILKGYLINIVWRCYKYLTMHQNTMSIMLPYVIPENAMGSVSVPSAFVAQSTANVSAKEIPPPYSEVVMEAPPSYSESSKLGEKRAENEKDGH